VTSALVVLDFEEVDLVPDFTLIGGRNNAVDDVGVDLETVEVSVSDAPLEMPVDGRVIVF